MKIEKISSEESEMIADLYNAMTADSKREAASIVKIIRDRIGRQPYNSETGQRQSKIFRDDTNNPLVRALATYDQWQDQAGITGHIYSPTSKKELNKMSRKEVAEIRRELQKTEKALALAEKPKQEVERNLTPISLPDKGKYLRERPESADIPGVIHLPKKQKRPENKW
jgi:protein subunit release factor A